MKKIATRDAYGEILLELGAIYPELVVLGADLSSSTKTIAFAKAYPDRFFNMGIAEQNMLSTAAGMAHIGLCPFVSSFAMFAVGRAWEQIRNSIAHNDFAVKIAATHAGITLGEDGASHQIIEDIALTTVIPNMQVFVPADAIETKAIIKALIKDNKPSYIRLGRHAVSSVFEDNTINFAIGKSQYITKGNDITILAYGVMTSIALDATKELKEKHNINAELINLSSIKPLDKNTILESIIKTKKVIIAEEHNYINGVNQQIASLLIENNINNCKFKTIAINDRFGQSGKPDELLKEYGLTAENIINTTLSLTK